mmetsp:Transcript_23439/g.26020  ORF Transcript_23439/g.26020 Transcript_23439/m.26020 type:complete len:123 (+) Transcript_23439:190-558(+)
MDNSNGAESSEKLQGWLKKKGDKGPIKTWKNRWFDYNEAKKRLYYFKDKHEAEMGYIDLSRIKAVYKLPNVAFGFAFSVPGRNYVLQAFSEAERDEWLQGVLSRTGLQLAPPTKRERKDSMA